MLDRKSFFREWSPFVCALGLLVFVLAPSASAQEVSAKDAPGSEEEAKPAGLRPVAQANAFLKTLSEAEKEKATFDFDSEKRVQWHFIPMETRKGLPLMEMQQPQKDAAMKLMRSVVSQVGYNKATKIMQLESLLLKLEGPSSEGRRNPEKYYFTLFGAPKRGQKWGLSIEGHHISLNFVFQGNKMLDSTPQFYAANPATLKEDYGEGFPKGLRVLRAEEQTAFTLVKSLDEEQLGKATLPGDTPSEIRGAGEPQPSREVLAGLSVSEMNADQQEQLKKVLTAYTAKMKPAVAKARWAQIDEAGFDKLTFTWSGSQRPGIGHYYVIQGPTFVVEFINVQPDAAGNPANHIHCVWRDMDGDFGLENPAASDS